MPTPWGDLDAIRGRQRRTPQLRKGSQILRMCFWRGGATAGGRATCGGHRPRKRRNPRKARFFAKQKMRPNEVLPEYHIFVNYLLGEALYWRFARHNSRQFTRIRPPLPCGDSLRRQSPARTTAREARAIRNPKQLSPVQNTRFETGPIVHSFRKRKAGNSLACSATGRAIEQAAWFRPLPDATRRATRCTRRARCRRNCRRGLFS
jgi:hypothetical protein